jgi:hypothetical protein
MSTSSRVIENLLAQVGALQARRAELTGGGASLEEMAKRYEKYELKASMTHLSAGDQQAVTKLVEAAAILNRLFTVQLLGEEGSAAFDKVQAEHSSNVQLSRYMMINKGPYCVLDEGRNFLPQPNPFPDVKPERASFYPEDMTVAEFNSWASSLPKEEEEEARGFYTVIKRGADGKLFYTKYCEEYKAFLLPCMLLLREAAALTTNDSLRDFLTSRADAFGSNEYRESELKWMALDSPIEVTIGPYEVYEDELIGLKATFEAFVTIRDEAETAKLDLFQGMLQELEDNLPMDDAYKVKGIKSTPIRAVDVVYASGDTAGPQTLAFCLPNDEEVQHTPYTIHHTACTYRANTYSIHIFSKYSDV